MTIKNADMPAMPVIDSNGCSMRYGSEDLFADGLTKRETFCLHMGVAETGDEELDAIIRKGNRQKMAVSVMHGLIASPRGKFDHDNAEDAMRDAIIISDSLLAELERTSSSK